MTTVEAPREAPRAYPFSQDSGLVTDLTYAALCEQQPVSRVSLPYGGDVWLVTSHELVKTVLSDPRFSRVAPADRDVPRLRPTINREPALMNMDPPEHTRLRKLVTKAFTVRQIERLRPRVRQFVAELLDDLVAQGPPADLVQGFALPLPMKVICELLGVPLEDQDDFHAWTEASLSLLTSVGEDQIVEGRAKLLSYMTDLVCRCRREPTTDLLGELVRARDAEDPEDAEDRVSDLELAGVGAALLAAGYESTTNAISNITCVLLTHPDQLALLRANPDALLPRAIEELLRFIPAFSSAGGFPRYVTQDVRLGDVPLRAGDTVLVSLATANRDGRVFDDPDELRLDRAAKPHVAFGHGVHHCIGVHLARIELQEAIGALLRRFPTLELATAVEDIAWKQGRLFRGPHALPLHW